MDASCAVKVNVVGQRVGSYKPVTGAPKANETGWGSVSNSPILNVTDALLYLPFTRR